MVSGCILVALLLQFFAVDGNGLNAKKNLESPERFNFFDTELLKALNNAEPGNIVVSPVSIKATLAMLYEGAQGVSAKQLRGALRLPEDKELTRKYLHDFLLSLQKTSPKYKLEMGNRLYLDTHFDPEPEYVTTLKRYYFTDLERVNFTEPRVTAKKINDWVKTVTRGLIPQLVSEDSLSPDSLLFIANAVYFKGSWEKAFDVDGTSVKCFFTTPDKCFKTHMMEKFNYFRYADVGGLDSQAVELLYEDKQYSMLLILPNQKNSIQQLVRDLLHTSLEGVLSELELMEVQVSIPRFNIEFSTELAPTLATLGIIDVFSKNSNLSGISTSHPLQVSNVVHKAKIEVNEEGSTAGASTGIQVVPLMGSTVPNFYANRPFLFFIRDLEKGQFIFMGKVMMPEEATENSTVSHAGMGSVTDSNSGIDSLIEQVFPKPQQSAENATNTQNVLKPTPVNIPRINTGSLRNAGVYSRRNQQGEQMQQDRWQSPIGRAMVPPSSNSRLKTYAKERNGSTWSQSWN